MHAVMLDGTCLCLIPYFFSHDFLVYLITPMQLMYRPHKHTLETDIATDCKDCDTDAASHITYMRRILADQKHTWAKSDTVYVYDHAEKR